MKNETLQPMRFPNWDPSEFSFDRKAFVQMQVDSLNASKGDRTEMDCAVCHNKGVTYHMREDLSITARPCVCDSIRRCIHQMARSGLKNVLEKYTFDTFQAAAPWQATAKDKALAYARNPEGWFLASGQSGSGKTHLCTAICRELLLRGQEVTYISWRKEMAKLKGLSMDYEKRSQALDKLTTTPTLYIDDLYKAGAYTGCAVPTASDIGLTFDILDARYAGNLRTIVSTELSIQELLATDQTTAGRILECCGGNCFSIGQDIQKNYRLKKAAGV